MPTTKRFPYGKCPICNKAITIPGLDAYRCACEEWVDTAKARRVQEAAKKNRLKHNISSSVAAKNLSSKENSAILTQPSINSS